MIETKHPGPTTTAAVPLSARAVFRAVREPAITGEPPAALKMPQTNAPKPATPSPVDWPAQAELVLSAIEAGRYDGANRRGAKRRPLRVRAGLRLFSDAPHTPAWTLYTRDVHGRGLGFITPHRLPLGYGGLLELPAAAGTVLTIPCTLLRCREAAPGWYEGSLYFNRDQPELDG